LEMFDDIDNGFEELWRDRIKNDFFGEDGKIEKMLEDYLYQLWDEGLLHKWD